jgi:hypothetical protein
LEFGYAVAVMLVGLFVPLGIMKAFVMNNSYVPVDPGAIDREMVPKI